MRGCERPGKRGMVFPPSYYRDQFTPAQEREMERQQAEAEERESVEDPGPEDEAA